MTPVDQTIAHGMKGDCMRAAIASVLDLDILQVPHFGLFPDRSWHYVLTSFMWALGFDFSGTAQPDRRGLKAEDSINGYLLATVPSRNFEGKTHMVVMDLEGFVAHDPSPNKNYQGENILESGALMNWWMFEGRTDEAWKSWSGGGSQ